MAFEPRIVRPEDEDRDSGLHAGSRLPESRALGQRLPGPRFPGPRLSESRPAGAPPAGSDRLMPRSDDLDLPPDLEELAVQLSADAALLEHRYPATNARPRSQEPLAWRLARGAAAAMLVFGSMWWVSHRGTDDHRASAARTASAAHGNAGSAGDAGVACKCSGSGGRDESRIEFAVEFAFGNVVENAAERRRAGAGSWRPGGRRFGNGPSPRKFVIAARHAHGGR